MEMVSGLSLTEEALNFYAAVALSGLIFISYSTKHIVVVFFFFTVYSFPAGTN